MKDVWLIGASQMAQDYIKVLDALEVKVTVIGRGQVNADACAKATGCRIQAGGVERFLTTKPKMCTHAIVSVGMEALFDTAKKLLEYGVADILIEKPGAMDLEQIKTLDTLAKEKNVNVFIAYNRRFYASTLKAQDYIAKDGGVTSFNFEFTEWAHVIAPLYKAEGVKEKLFLGNSTHVVDMAFYLGGLPKELSTFTSGGLDWHPSASIFSGAGVSEKNALFSYQANWESAGRWSVEVLTKEHRFIFRPMEKLQIQKRGSIVLAFDETIDYSLDEEFKPGLYLQTQAFIKGEFSSMCRLEEQVEMMSVYNDMANY